MSSGYGFRGGYRMLMMMMKWVKRKKVLRTLSEARTMEKTTNLLKLLVRIHEEFIESCAYVRVCLHMYMNSRLVGNRWLGIKGHCEWLKIQSFTGIDGAKFSTLWKILWAKNLTVHIQYFSMWNCKEFSFILSSTALLEHQKIQKIWKISARKGQCQKPTLNAWDPRPLTQHCIKNRHHSETYIPTWAQEHLRKHYIM